MLILAVALGSGAIFASCIVGRGIETSMKQSFSRMGADLLVVPEETLVNITSALLTVQPTEATFDAHLIDQLRQLNGVAQVSPQTIYHVPIMSNMPEHKANLIAFDPASDFTILPWVQSKLPRLPMLGDLYIGSRRTESLGDEVEPCNTPAIVYGKLGKSGVGPLDESMFATYDTVAKLMTIDGTLDKKLFHRDHISAALIKLDFGATPEQVRFAIAKLKGIKVISGATIVTSTRQTITALLGGMLVFIALMLLGSLILVSLLFTAIIEERSREIGLLSAIGTKRNDIIKMLVTEAAFATGFGGVGGIILGSGLLNVFQHSIVFYLETMHISFAWPTMPEIAITAIACTLVAAVLGLLGSFLPAWRIGGKEAYQLLQSDMK